MVSDRFANSTLAYQGYGRGLALEDLAALHRFALGDFAPDLTADPRSAGRDRSRPGSGARGVSPTDSSASTELSTNGLRQGFRQIAADNPARCVLIDAIERSADGPPSDTRRCRGTSAGIALSAGTADGT